LHYQPRGFGGGLFSNIPPVVRQLLILNVFVFLITALMGNQTRNQINYLFGLVPALVVGKGMIWQLVTYMFLHGSFSHVFFNMFGLLIFGSDLERDWGSRAFLKYYMVTGIGAGVINVMAGYVFGGTSIPTIGASGAVFGLLLAFGLAYPFRQIYLMFMFPIPARTFVVLYAMLELFMGLSNPHGGVARFAHLGGMLVGFLYLRQGRLLGSWRRVAGQAFSQRGKTGARPRPKGHRDPVVSPEEERRRKSEMERILEKISSEGMGSLTSEEKRTLKESADRARRRQGGER